jgi:hypothetical protein
VAVAANRASSSSPTTRKKRFSSFNYVETKLGCGAPGHRMCPLLSHAATEQKQEQSTSESKSDRQKATTKILSNKESINVLYGNTIDKRK